MTSPMLKPAFAHVLPVFAVAFAFGLAGQIGFGLIPLIRQAKG